MHYALLISKNDCWAWGVRTCFRSLLRNSWYNWSNWQHASVRVALPLRYLKSYFDRKSFSNAISAAERAARGALLRWGVGLSDSQVPKWVPTVFPVSAGLIPLSLSHLTPSLIFFNSLSFRTNTGIPPAPGVGGGPETTAGEKTGNFFLPLEGRNYVIS